MPMPVAVPSVTSACSSARLCTSKCSASTAGNTLLRRSVKSWAAWRTLPGGSEESNEKVTVRMAKPPAVSASPLEELDHDLDERRGDGVARVGHDCQLALG